MDGGWGNQCVTVLLGLGLTVRYSAVDLQNIPKSPGDAIDETDFFEELASHYCGLFLVLLKVDGALACCCYTCREESVSVKDDG